MEFIPAKHIVTRTKSRAWFGADYNMNIYRGCCHGCIYCDSRSDCYGIDDFDRVRAKADAPLIIADDLRRKRVKGVVAIGAMSDPYNPFEAELRLTRGALELIDRYGFGVTLATKSALVTRDIDVLQSVARTSPVLVKLTVTTYDDGLCALIEPGAARSSERFGAISLLSAAGIPCCVLLMPVLPFINDTLENVLGIVDAAHDAGAAALYPAPGVTLRDGQREHFLARLDERFAGVKKRYLSAFGNAYYCPSPDAKRLYSAIAKRCEDYGMAYKMRDIIARYQNAYATEQLSWF